MGLGEGNRQPEGGWGPYLGMCRHRVQSAGHLYHTRESLLGSRLSTGCKQMVSPAHLLHLYPRGMPPYLSFFGFLHLSGIQVAVQ